MDIPETDCAPASHKGRRYPVLQAAFGRDNRCQSWMFLFCILFGLTLIAETQAAGDGGWLLYASFLHHGVRLYSQMHLALQPLVVLETEFFLKIFGQSWIASKIPAVLHLFAYCIALWLLVRKSGFTDAQKAIVFGCGFCFPLGFEAYRFDDYHVLADCFQLYSVLALLALPKASKQRNLLILAAVLGALCGLSLTTRLNDGAALVVGVVLGIALLAPQHRLRALALFSLAAALTVVLVVGCTGDSLRDYASYSIFHAAGSKGGASSVLASPLQLPINTLLWLRTHRDNDLLDVYVILWGTLWVLLKRAIQRRGNNLELAAAAGCLALLLLAHRFFHWMIPFDTAPSAPVSLVSMSAVGVLFAYVLAAILSYRCFRWLLRSGRPYSWDCREIILLIPIGQLASGSMSTAGTHLGLYGPLGVLIVLLSISPPFVFRTQWPRSIAIAVAAILVVATALFKAEDPYSWHTYRVRPLFVDRTLYQHPVYGPMIIDKDLLAFIQPVCNALDSAGAQPQLLSLPYSYASYFCATPPWDGYVQTFFDTSSKETIQVLMDRLDTAPPTWIFYQRQLNTLALHEKVFNHGQPLEHRYLDQMIEQKIADGSWKVVYTSSYGDSPYWDNHWQLIRTTP